MNITIGVLAHVDAGKTTFSEQLLYHTKTIRNRGRVDHKDAFLDSHEIEKERGITVFADQATFSYNDSTYYLIDTPGHVDFSPEMERAIQVMDYAIVIISAVEGVEGHTETVWQLLQKHKVPTFFFINKTDREGADVDSVLAEIRINLTEDAVDITKSYDNGKMDEELVEFIAERDQQLFEAYMESGYEQSLWHKTFKTMIRKNIVYPCVHGSALKDVGVHEFLEKLDLLTETRYSDEGDFSGQVYKIRYDENGNRVSFMKALGGTLSVRDELSYGKGEERKTDKVTQIRVYNGTKYTTINQVSSGELFAVVGLSDAVIGDGVGVNVEKSIFELVPTLRSKVVFDPSIPAKDMLQCFCKLDAEDPSLQVIWDEHFQEIHIHVMGVIQLEVLEQLIKERFHYDVSFQVPEILYKETIETSVVGYGHFEPLGHYAEVHLKLEPAPRGTGVTFNNDCHANDLSVGSQNLVRKHLVERDHHGLLTGSPITDVEITLLTGRAHHQHTSGGDFREATLRALRQGLEQAQNILLEPYYNFKIKVGIDEIGRVLSDIQQASGTFNAPKTVDDKTVVTGRVPVATFMNYQKEFASFTHGKGILNLRFAGYDRCHNEADVIHKMDYRKDADPEYSSNSIFCAKGKGYTVPWDQAKKQMHCLS
ncbi:GTP-binding protein [Ornithinibacillus sp. L9]|uniref:GTP-binding protein n=1 Tax=Ornithinibacillus caprae TaxID=2678566 RepID=A0A6N8FQ66_9BACI|nr:TetM/TetW/TetO/TetS family tetracycline resistance ribosomal protection protein [Ornithinibacillus caprae]MUK90407.1 GTP-binding protein [Ornithinibacillus caprae]